MKTGLRYSDIQRLPSQKKYFKNSFFCFFFANFLAFLLVLPLTPLCQASHVIEGKVLQVKDGDTVVIAPAEGGAFFTCRLYGIDAPEIAHGNKPAQPYGVEAMRFLKRLVLGQMVEVDLTGSRTYNREVCIIRKDGLNINLEMVKSGYAWAYKRYLRSPYASEFLNAEDEARANRRGLWEQVNPLPPWEYRHR